MQDSECVQATAAARKKAPMSSECLVLCLLNCDKTSAKQCYNRQFKGIMHMNWRLLRPHYRRPLKNVKYWCSPSYNAKYWRRGACRSVSTARTQRFKSSETYSKYLRHCLGLAGETSVLINLCQLWDMVNERMFTEIWRINLCQKRLTATKSVGPICSDQKTYVQLARGLISGVFQSETAFNAYTGNTKVRLLKVLNVNAFRKAHKCERKPLKVSTFAAL